MIREAVFCVLFLAATAGADKPGPGFIAIPGDVNLDGKVTREDAEALCAYVICGTPLPMLGLRNADVSGDGTISVYDCHVIARMTATPDDMNYRVHCVRPARLDTLKRMHR